MAQDEEPRPPQRVICGDGTVAEWKGSGLQSRDPGFDPRRCLQRV